MRVELHPCERCREQLCSAPYVCVRCQHDALEKLRRHVESGALSDWFEARDTHVNRMTQGWVTYFVKLAGCYPGHWDKQLFDILNAALIRGFVFTFDPQPPSHYQPTRGYFHPEKFKAGEIPPTERGLP